MGTAQRYLAYLILFLVGASVLAIIVALLLPVFGVDARVPGSGWAYVTAVPLTALPIAVLCIIALFIVNAVQRARANQKAAK